MNYESYAKAAIVRDYVAVLNSAAWLIMIIYRKAIESRPVRAFNER